MDKKPQLISEFFSGSGVGLTATIGGVFILLGFSSLFFLFVGIVILGFAYSSAKSGYDFKLKKYEKQIAAVESAKRREEQEKQQRRIDAEQRKEREEEAKRRAAIQREEDAKREAEEELEFEREQQEKQARVEALRQLLREDVA